MGGNSSRGESYHYDWDKINTDANGELVKPIFKNGCYGNPFDTFEDHETLKDILTWSITSNDRSSVPLNNKQELDKTLPVLRPDWDKLNNPPADKVQAMWIGHASLLVQLDGLNILTDPVFSTCCGPFGIVGHHRYRDAPCDVEDLPHIHAVVISHNHYDHLDYYTVTKLNRKFGKSLKWFVTSGQAKWMREQAGCANVTELGWWEESVMEKDGKMFTFVATPAQHWCRRAITDKFKALWCSWVVKGPTKSFYVAGDTGYCYAFKQIGRKYGPFSMAAIPIGAYEPRWFLRAQHVNPEEAVYIHKDIGARRSVGIHWGTFKQTDEHYMEPKQRLIQTTKDQGLDEGEFFTMYHGEVVAIYSPADFVENRSLYDGSTKFCTELALDILNEIR